MRSAVQCSADGGRSLKSMRTCEVPSQFYHPRVLEPPPPPLDFPYQITVYPSWCILENQAAPFVYRLLPGETVCGFFCTPLLTRKLQTWRGQFPHPEGKNKGAVECGGLIRFHRAAREVRNPEGPHQRGEGVGESFYPPDALAVARALS